MLTAAIFPFLILGCASSPPSPDPAPATAVAPKPPPAQDPAPASPPKPREFRNIPERSFQLDDLEVVDLEINGHKFKAFVMDSNDKRTEGFMWVEAADIKEEHAMIFAFSSEQPLSFWMKNTLQDLDIAYLSADKRIVSQGTMKALDETGFPSARAAQYAIEFKAGVLKKKGIKPGMTAKFPDRVRSID